MSWHGGRGNKGNYERGYDADDAEGGASRLPAPNAGPSRESDRTGHGNKRGLQSQCREVPELSAPRSSEVHVCRSAGRGQPAEEAARAVGRSYLLSGESASTVLSTAAAARRLEPLAGDLPGLARLGKITVEVIGGGIASVTVGLSLPARRGVRVADAWVRLARC